MTRAVLSLGSNLGDRYAELCAAVAALDDELLVASGVYETPPWPPGEQVPPYLNAAVLVCDQGDDPYHWLRRARELEAAAGRTRSEARPPGAPHEPRPLDVDVVMVWGADDQPVVANEPEFTLPHPRAHLRAFVLRPWLDIQPYAALPGHGWVTDLMRTEPVAGEVTQLSPRPELPLQSGA
ncbi:2-amino-4-hydroxy-6-hydroxymethyldihydropteridine diphosphokinase [Natronosporangium hydrolyticum]|uniref:2-amino-4-hydroxy-6-hydroxymethyldihydropteridine diphosphokinase n=1 Tax=Natronosporangium hydrolyticum TaxID=2811111 RepID=A0A895YG12_9ACTN|nr:2-amino-4-hydroxy-6-hydroxymethyldihydropteridine diphosphokinase [Natronosporangium hydrolyticum]QSB15042.1 2-amino-4-hydroxy-6-hydroxymethyldihydropteridine diphosphokinase [Natronosporangium hydrolyticum]